MYCSSFMMVYLICHMLSVYFVDLSVYFKYTDNAFAI